MADVVFDEIVSVLRKLEDLHLGVNLRAKGDYDTFKEILPKEMLCRYRTGDVRLHIDRDVLRSASQEDLSKVLSQFAKHLRDAKVGDAYFSWFGGYFDEPAYDRLVVVVPKTQKTLAALKKLLRTDVEDRFIRTVSETLSETLSGQRDRAAEIVGVKGAKAIERNAVKYLSKNMGGIRQCVHN
jgi:hypothetical protein